MIFTKDNAMIVAIDHGNSYIKTKGSVFPSAYKKNPPMPEMAEDWIKYNGDYYALTFYRLPYRCDKTENDDYYILTLFAIAKQLEKERTCSFSIEPAVASKIVLAVGLPPKYYKDFKDSFKKYLMRNGETVTFMHNNNYYKIRISKVYVFPQAYSAVSDQYEEFSKLVTKVIVDIGGYTIDTLLYNKGELNMAGCDSFGMGTIIMYESINKHIKEEYGSQLDESEIDNVILGKKSILPSNVIDLINDDVKAYTDKMLEAIDKKVNGLMFKPVTFVGGGSLLLKDYIMKSNKVSTDITFNENQSANAIGYEQMADEVAYD